MCVRVCACVCVCAGEGGMIGGRGAWRGENDERGGASE